MIENNIVNIIKIDYPNITPSEYKRVYAKLYYQLNKDNIEFKNKMNQMNKNYYEKNKEAVLTLRYNNYNDNIDYYREKRLEAHENQKTNEEYLNKRRIACKIYYATHREKLQKYNIANYYEKKRDNQRV